MFEAKFYFIVCSLNISAFTVLYELSNFEKLYEGNKFLRTK